jgi:hypothetical protein
MRHHLHEREKGKAKMKTTNLIEQYLAIIDEDGPEPNNPRLEAIQSRMSEEELQELIDRPCGSGSFADEISRLVEARDRLAQAKHVAMMSNIVEAYCELVFFMRQVEAHKRKADALYPLLAIPSPAVGKG